MNIFEHYQKNYSQIEGWFEETAVGIWDTLLTFQTNRKIKGNLLEIGVWKGKTAFLQALHSKAGETCVLVDASLSSETTATIQKSNQTCTYSFHHCRSEDIFNTPIYHTGKGQYRWIHIDGEHTGYAVLKDLELAHALLSRDGIICIDDFLSAQYPQITRAVFRYLEDHAIELKMFLCGFNKAYICRTEAHHLYLQFTKYCMLDGLSDRDMEEVTLCKTSTAGDLNCFGLTPNYENVRHRGLDWDPKNLPI